MFIKLLIISVILIGVALAGLAVSMLIKPRGRFPETHISRNREMQKRGIRCRSRIQTLDAQTRRKNSRQM